MLNTRIVIISGPCGTGKSSVAGMLAENSVYERAVHVHTDDFYGYIRKGYIGPWLAESKDQNTVVAETIAVCAASFAEGGYEVFIDGVIGPWYLEPWIKVAHTGINVYYILLRPDLQTTLLRGVNRKGPYDLVDPVVIEKMWKEFADTGLYESHVIDTTNHTVKESVKAIKDMLNENKLRIGI